MRSVFLLLSLAAALGGMRYGQIHGQCGSANPQNSRSPGTEYVAPDSKGIQTEAARTSAIPDYLDLPAHIEPDPTRVVHVFAPAGGRIVEMKVRPWDHVEKGQTLATLESSDLARAVADYHKALADHQVKQKALARAQDLLEHNAIAEKDFQQAQGDAAAVPGGSRGRARTSSGVRHGPRPRLDSASGESAARRSRPRHRRRARRIFASALPRRQPLAPSPTSPASGPWAISTNRISPPRSPARPRRSPSTPIPASIGPAA